MLSNYAYILLKPDSMRDILYPLFVKDLENAGFKIVKHQSLYLTPEQIKELYGNLKEKKWFPEMEKFLSSGLSLLLIVKYEPDKNHTQRKVKDAITLIKELKGKALKGGWREKYRLPKERPKEKFFENRIHTPDSYQKFIKELSILLNNESLNDLKVREHELYAELLKYQRENKEIKLC